MQKSRTFDLTKYDLDIKTIKMRTVDSRDAIEAASRCIPPDNGDINAIMFGVMHRHQMVAQAIEEVDGKPTGGPYVQADRWSLKTMEFVREIYEFMNNVPAETRESFRKELAGSSASATQPST